MLNIGYFHFDTYFTNMIILYYKYIEMDNKKMDYFSDASMSDSESEDEEEPLYTQRELDYWELESFLDNRRPPPVLEYAAELGVVTLRSCIMDHDDCKIEQVVNPKTVHSWNDYWTRRPIDQSSLFSEDDWDAIGEYCRELCTTCVPHPPRTMVRSCIKHLLHYGKFK